MFPIPAGVRWNEAMPVILPGAERVEKSLPAPEGKKSQPPKPVRPPGRPAGGLWYGPAAAGDESAATVVEQRSEMVKKEPVRPPKQKNDPRHVALARELRDRYLEALNAGEIPLPLTGPEAAKYDVSRRVEAMPRGAPKRLIASEATVRRLLSAA